MGSRPINLFSFQILPEKNLKIQLLNEKKYAAIDKKLLATQVLDL